MSPNSPLTPHPSSLTPHPSPLTPHSSTFNPRIAVLADDLSGATELGAAACARGLAVVVRLEADASAEDAVSVFSTGSRELTAAEAGARTRAFAEAIRASGRFDRVFVKIDSVLRGHVGLSGEAVARALGAQHMVLGAGNPSRNRIVQDGKLWVDGVALDESAFRDDPHHPAMTSDVARIWRESGGGGGPGLLILETGEAGALAAGAAKLTPGMLPVGSLDFFQACLDQWFPERRAGEGAAAALAPVARTAIVCGSRAGWPGRVASAERHGWAVTILGEAVPERTLAANTLFGLGDRDHGSALDAAERLGAAAARLIAHGRPDRICLEGGHTAASVLTALGWRDLELAGEAAPGVALARSNAHHAEILIKPGSYDWPEAIWGS